MKSLEVPALRAHIELLAAQPDADGLRALFTTWITLPQPALDKLVPQVLDGCVAHLRDHGPFDRECRTALELAEAYPGDAGVLAALLLNRIVLHPGEAIYLPAGNLHAYLHGTGVEIMANSDNVLRGGLTPKHVDVPELLRVLDFRCGDVPVLRGDAVGHLTAYRTPAPEFHLSTLDWTSESGDVEGEWIDSAGPQILLCTAGAARLTTADGRRLDLARGQSVWVAAADPSVLVEPVGLAECGRVQLFRATAGVA
nr:hypothetical protein GCM10020241_44890 [Streptoalloteichus tenebrarius]